MDRTLSRAANKGREAVVKLLLATESVNLDSKNCFKQTSRSLATRREHTTVVKLLQRHGLPGQNTPKHWINMEHPITQSKGSYKLLIVVEPQAGQIRTCAIITRKLLTRFRYSSVADNTD
jgi:hypothetical protein